MGMTVFAIGCHPDDIEFMMSGTLMALAEAGCAIHYLNVANGSCGTDRLDPAEIVAIRREEAMAAARDIGAVFHESLVNDLEVFYERDILLRLGAIVREVAPDIILTHYPDEYMEDHANTCRLAVSAAFCRGMRNFPVIPPTPPVTREVTLYHAVPYGLRDPLRRQVMPGLFVNVTGFMTRKTAMLARHRSQKTWLDRSQGMDSYLTAMTEMCRAIGSMSGQCEFAEGWTRHLHRGFTARDTDPLAEMLPELAMINPEFERRLCNWKNCAITP